MQKVSDSVSLLGLDVSHHNQSVKLRTYIECSGHKRRKWQIVTKDETNLSQSIKAGRINTKERKISSHLGGQVLLPSSSLLLRKLKMESLRADLDLSSDLNSQSQKRMLVETARAWKTLLLSFWRKPSNENSCVLRWLCWQFDIFNK